MILFSGQSVHSHIGQISGIDIPTLESIQCEPGSFCGVALMYLVNFLLMIILVGCQNLIQASAVQESPLTYEMREWLSQPNRMDFEWSVNLSKPTLTSQQRYFVQITATIPTKRLETVHPRIFNLYTPANLAKPLTRFLSEIGVKQREYPHYLHIHSPRSWPRSSVRVPT